MNTGITENTEDVAWYSKEYSNFRGGGDKARTRKIFHHQIIRDIKHVGNQSK